MRIDDLNNISNINGRFDVDISGIEINFNFKRSLSKEVDTLLIGFHGTADRLKRDLPVFIPFLPEIEGYVHQLAISDPSLRCSTDLSMSWYAGDKNFLAQKILPQLFLKISRALNVRRTIYFGTSGGGFAALFYSRQHTGSLALEHFSFS